MSKLSEALAKASEIRAREQAATPGVWRVSMTGYSIKSSRENTPHDGDFPEIVARVFANPTAQTVKDFDFIVGARVDVPLLLAALEEARALLTEAARDLALQENFQDETLRGRINEALGRG